MSLEKLKKDFQDYLESWEPGTELVFDLSPSHASKEAYEDTERGRHLRKQISDHHVVRRVWQMFRNEVDLGDYGVDLPDDIDHTPQSLFV
jgi:isocitrate lyase